MVTAGVVASRPVPSRVSAEEALGWLRDVPDPELPVVSIVDLGIVRGVSWEDEGDTGPTLVVRVTPTYSGCPATEVIAQAIRDTLRAHGVARCTVRTQLAPAWTTDWIEPGAREALRAYGIAPPQPRVPGEQGIDTAALLSGRGADKVPCPRCASPRTRRLAAFGSTACKALYQCSACLEPFDYFKPH